MLGGLLIGGAVIPGACFLKALEFEHDDAVAGFAFNGFHRPVDAKRLQVVTLAGIAVSVLAFVVTMFKVSSYGASSTAFG